jgi:alkyl sulfatase BDS1-like metallo-beta-lactamase superfamily hydrolase
MIGRLSLDQLFDAMAIRLDGQRAWGKRIVVNWEIGGEPHVMTLENAVLGHVPGGPAPDGDVSVRLPRATFDAILLQTANPAEELAAGRIEIEGDGAKLGEVLGLLDEPDRDFAIVTP